jgi:hypothetical protein
MSDAVCALLGLPWQHMWVDEVLGCATQARLWYIGD